MLVVVVAVAGVTVLAVLVVDVAGMLDRGMAAGGAVDVHVAGVAQMERGHRGGDIIHVIDVEVMDVAIVEVVQVVPMGDGRVTAPRVMLVVVRGVRLMLGGGGGAHGESWSHIPGVEAHPGVGV